MWSKRGAIRGIFLCVFAIGACSPATRPPEPDSSTPIDATTQDRASIVDVANERDAEADTATDDVGSDTGIDSGIEIDAAAEGVAREAESDVGPAIDVVDVPDAPDAPDVRDVPDVPDVPMPTAALWDMAEWDRSVWQ